MSYEITVKPAGLHFTATPEESLLDAALRHGINIPHGCKDGACGACKGKVRQGTVDLEGYKAHALSEAEIAEGKVLFCCAKATSDLEIEDSRIVRTGVIQVKTMPARIEVLEKRVHDVIELGLRLPAREVFEFRAGQYVDLLLKDGKRRSYSLANAPGKEGLLELHVRHVPGGMFTEQVFSSMKVKDMLRFEGPLGGFFLREDSQKPVILLASGTGFAPIKSMVEHALAQGSTRSFHIYWGCRSKRDLYLPELPVAWASQHGNILYTPVLSEPAIEDAWEGRSGFVHEAVMEDYPDLSGHQVYACGAPVMVDSACRDFIQRCGLPEEEFFSDAFTFSAPGS